MAKIRIGLGTEFTLKNSNLGINTTTPQQRLDVAGVARAKDLKVTGVSSFTAYEGFLRSDNQIDESIDLEFGNGINASLSGEIIVGTGVTVTIASVGLGTTMVGVGTHTIENTIDTTDVNTAGGSQIECLKVYNTFTPPNGGTNERPYAPKPGELYYNFDFKTIEFYDGYGWRQVDNTTRSGRGVFAGGNPGVSPLSRTDSIDFIQVSTLGNSQNFGTLVSAKDSPGFGSVSNGWRGVFMGGWQTPVATNEMDYITIASEGNAVDFGNLNTAGGFNAACSSSTRGISMGGYPLINDIQYIEIVTLGDALDFGNLGSVVESHSGLASPTRGISAAGMSPNATSFIEVITISSKGDALIFGDLTEKKRGVGTVSSTTRGIFAGGLDNPTTSTHLNTIEFITIASNGNGTDFGDLTLGRRKPAGASNSTRGVFAYGYVAPARYNTMDYITIASTGNAIDFGDGSGPLRNGAGYCSDSHGGLGGF